jgi:uncharacterized GH25 family protein
MRQSKPFLGLLLLFLFAATALAHDTFLLPERFSAPAGTTVALDLTSGMGFPFLDTAIKPERVAFARGRIAGKTFEIKDFDPAEHSLRFHARFSKPGVATVGVDLKPRTLNLELDKVQEYFDEIDPPDEVKKHWATMPEPKRWRESYVKHSKTVVRVGNFEKDDSWAAPLGMALEIVPETDPTALKPGDEFAVHVLKDGKPFPGFSLGIIREEMFRGEFKKTDANGRVVFKLDKVGRWLLRGTDLRPSSKPNLEWESNFTTLTIEVAGK